MEDIESNSPQFVGDFYVATQFSVFRLKVNNLTETPAIMKMAFHGRSPERVPVGGSLHARCYWAITSIGIVPYRMENNQKGVSEFAGTLLPVEELPRSRCGQKSGPIMGLFLKQEDAESCVAYCSRQNPPLNGFEDEQFDTVTIHMLKKIGISHPLITISTRDRRNTKFALPTRLLKHVLSPAESQ